MFVQLFYASLINGGVEQSNSKAIKAKEIDIMKRG